MDPGLKSPARGSGAHAILPQCGTFLARAEARSRSAGRPPNDAIASLTALYCAGRDYRDRVAYRQPVGPPIAEQAVGHEEEMMSTQQSMWHNEVNTSAWDS